MFIIFLLNRMDSDVFIFIEKIYFYASIRVLLYRLLYSQTENCLKTRTSFWYFAAGLYCNLWTLSKRAMSPAPFILGNYKKLYLTNIHVS